MQRDRRILNTDWRSVVLPINQCGFTGLETLTHHETLDGMSLGPLSLDVFTDHSGGIRLLLSDSLGGLSAVLLCPAGVCRYKFTLERGRGHRYTRQLFAWANAHGIRATHSEFLTPAGEASI